MKPKKTISERLTAPYQLVGRSEENLAERRTLSVTYGKLLVIVSSLLFLIFIRSLFLSRTLLAKWFDPKYEIAAQRKQLIYFAQRMDSLAVEVDREDKFIQNF